MSNRLRAIFDYYRFAGNKRLAALITETETQCGAAVSDSDLAFVNAAGETDVLKKPLSKRVPDNN